MVKSKGVPIFSVNTVLKPSEENCIQKLVRIVVLRWYYYNEYVPTIVFAARLYPKYLDSDILTTYNAFPEIWKRSILLPVNVSWN